MNHGVEVFHFSAKNNKVIEVTSKPYTFELEQVLIERFGIELIKQITENNSVSLDVDLEAVREDFPQLLELKNQQIDWSKQPYDEIARVYYFFFRVQTECEIKSIKIRNRNPALQTGGTSSSVSFDPSKYLSQQELKDFPIWVISKESVREFYWLRKNLCGCELVKMSGLHITSQKQKEQIIENYLKNYGSQS